MEKFRSFELNKNTSEDREQQVDLLLRFMDNTRNIKPLQDKKIDEIFSGDENKKAFIEKMDTDEFIQLLNGLNGILRNKKKEDWRMDGDNVGVGGNVFGGLEYISPNQEDKPELLGKLLSAVKEMEKDGREWQDIALLVSASINGIHPYMDGNGRTSRFLYSILSEGYDKEKIKQELSKSATFEGTEININPGLIQDKIEDLIKNELGIEDFKINKDKIAGMIQGGQEIEFNENIDDKRKQFLNLYEIDKDYLFWSVYKFLQEDTTINKNEVLKQMNDKSAIVASDLSKTLSQDQLDQILVNYRDIKKEYVEKLIGSIVNPTDEAYKVDVGEQKIPLKNYFENKLQEERENKLLEEKNDKEKEDNRRKNDEKIKEKENLIKSRFENGEGDYKSFDVSELKAINKLENSVAEMTNIDKQEYSEEQKIEILKNSLYNLAQKINSQVSISEDQIGDYVENKKGELLDLFGRFKKISEIIDFVESSGVFSYKIHTSKDYETPYYSQETLDQRVNKTLFLDDLFSQSVYYVNASGSSLRLKLHEIKSDKLANVIQSTTEQIFYNDEMVDYIDKKVIKVSDLSPEKRKFVFEMTTPEFRKNLLTPEESQQSIKSKIGVIIDENDYYINVPEKSACHSGWMVVGVDKLQQRP